jgi:hypothetical protein
MRPVVACSFLMFCLVVAGCKKRDNGSGQSSAPQPAKPAPGVSIESLAASPVPAPAEAPPAPVPTAPTESATPDTPTPAPGTGASLSAAARKKRNLDWLKILATGTPQQQQKVQDQLTLLDSEQLTEITQLYEQQQKGK